jgi:surface protein
MGTIAEKLEYLNDTKGLIKDAIADKGVDMSDDPTFRDYPERIGEISGGGGGPLDPKKVYEETRPADWLPMTADEEFDNNRIEMLVHIPDGGSSLCAFTVATTGGQYLVEVDGVLVGSLSSNQKFEIDLDSDAYGNLTNDGMKQVMIVVTAATGNLMSFTPSTHSKKTTSNFCQWSIVEIKARGSEIQTFRVGNSSANRTLVALKYFSLLGSNSITSATSMFQYCYSLTAIPQLDTSSVTSMSNMFQYCYSLTAIPQLDTSSVTSMSNTFQYCYSLTAIPQLDTSSVTNMDNMFQYCYSLTAIPQLDTSSVTNMSNTFYYCYSLTAIPQLDTSSVTSMDNMFSGCYSLAKITLNPDVTGWAGVAIALTQCSLSRKALVSLFNSLPTVTTQRNIDLTGNPGVSELTDADKLIATNKNWTLTL